MNERTVTVVAVQPRVDVGEVERNLVHLEDLIRRAHREHDPDMITLPEAMTSPNVYAKPMHGVARPVDGQPFQMLTRLARELGCVVGGGFLAVRGRDVYGTYVLAEPDGGAHLHDKDLPTLWENNYYRGGDDDGFFPDTSLGPVGCANGWEWARVRTARRLRGRARMLVGGMCWPNYPYYPPGILDRIPRRERQIQRQLGRELPGQMARLLGAPVVMPSLVGDTTFDTVLAPGVPWRTEAIGETQIVERDGTILGRLTYEDGEGYIAADVRLAEPEPLDPLPDRFWIPVMPASIRVLWQPVCWHGRIRYHGMKALRRHQWQDMPAGDLPDRVHGDREPEPAPIAG
jgi:predicted amidohydrolase